VRSKGGDWRGGSASLWFLTSRNESRTLAPSKTTSVHDSLQLLGLDSDRSSGKPSNSCKRANHDQGNEGGFGSREQPDSPLSAGHDEQDQSRRVQSKT
jgi:hypothetical protein